LATDPTSVKIPGKPRDHGDDEPGLLRIRQAGNKRLQNEDCRDIADEVRQARSDDREDPHILEVQPVEHRDGLGASRAVSRLSRQ
jgi:hypothetical protein